METKEFVLDVPMYAHSQDIEGRRATVAGLLLNGLFHVGVSLCGPSDQFCKRTGRKIALHRATCVYAHTQSPPKSFKEAKSVLHDIANQAVSYGERGRWKFNA